MVNRFHIAFVPDGVGGNGWLCGRIKMIDTCMEMCTCGCDCKVFPN